MNTWTERLFFAFGAAGATLIIFQLFGGVIWDTPEEIRAAAIGAGWQTFYICLVYDWLSGSFIEKINKKARQMSWRDMEQIINDRAKKEKTQ